MNKRTVFLSLAGLLGIGALAVGWHAKSARTPSDAMKGPKPALVQTIDAQSGMLARTLELTGTVTANAEISILPKIEQPIRWMTVQEGDRVTAGEVLVRLDTMEMDAQLRSAEAERQVAVAALRDMQAGARPQEIGQAQAAFRQAEAAYRRAVNAERNAHALYRGGQTGLPVQAVQDAEGKLSVATAQRDAAQAALEAATRNLEQVRQIVKLNTTQLQAVNDARGKVDTATAQQDAAATAAENAKVEHERAQALLKIGGISQEAADRASAQYRTSQAQWNSAKSALTTAQEGYRLAKSLLDTNAVPQQQLADAQGRANVAKAQLTAADASVTAAEKQFAQVKVLQNGPLPQREMDEAAGRVAETKAAMEAARERVALLQAGASYTQLATAQARVQQAAAKCAYWRTQVALCTLKAPISGVVTRRWKYVGDIAEPKQPLLTIAQDGRQLVKTAVSDRDVAGLQAGMPARVTLDALPGAPLTISVTNVYPSADPTTRLVPVELLLPQLPRPIAEGSFARIAINQGQQRGIVVPLAAVVPQAGGKAAVFLVTPAMTAERRLVTTGLEADGKVLIVTGVDEGAQVVVQGQDALKEGQPVKVMPGKPGMAPADGGPGQQQPDSGMRPMHKDNVPTQGTAATGGNPR
ncbi:MAG: efflux RND transporter periplasmic adaptor subunit [Armatimonadota bacterium]